MAWMPKTRRQRPPAISVVMPVHNGERFLGEAIDSILCQSFADFELVVVDDGSTDSSSAILAGYASRDRRMIVHRQANRGSVAALNAGVGLARAPLIARLDCDDLAAPERLAIQHRFLAENAEVGLVGGDIELIDEDGRTFAAARYPSEDDEIRDAFPRSTPFVHSAVTMRREVFERAGGYRPGFELAEDLDLWLRIAERGALANLDATVAMYRLHESQASARKLELQAIRALAARLSARARARGEADPFAAGGPIDEAVVLAAGGSAVEIDAAIVDAAIWLGKTLDRAGYRRAAAELFAIGFERARSSRDSSSLTGSMRRAAAELRSEHGEPLRAKLEHLRARLTEKRRQPGP